MDLTKFDFTEKELLEEAKKRGFYNGRGPYNELFNDLFFDGGQVEFKSDLDEQFKDVAWRYCRGLMQSFSIKHEEKGAICSMLMSELLELPKKKGLKNKIKNFLR